MGRVICNNRVGLAIRKAIAGAHRGTREVESGVDAGSTFALRLPTFGTTANPAERK